MIKELSLQALMMKYMCELDPKKAPKKHKSSSKSCFPGLLGRRIFIQQNSKLLAWKESRVGISVCQLP
jgi:hypothetical protein